jgi:hypothetical protein
MSPSGYLADAGPTGPTASATGDSDSTVRETVFVLPLAGLFAPESDPSVRFPDHYAEVQGYAVADNGTVALAIAGDGTHAATLLDEAWAGLERKGIVLRRADPSPNRAGPASAVTVRLDLGPTVCDLLRSSLILPVRAQAGQAEVHVIGTAAEAKALELALEREGIPPISVAIGEPDPTYLGTKLTAEDWAFLGLLSSLGVFDGPDHPNEQAAARLVGFDRAEFTAKVETVEAGMRLLVAGLFAPPERSDGPRRAA